MNKKCVLITGHAGGIGQALVKNFKKKNYYTIGIDIEESVDADLNIKTDLSDVEKSIKQIDSELVKNNITTIKCLINNGATQIKSTFEHTSIKDFNTTLNVNLLAPFFLTQKLKPYLLEGNGIVINISSIHATQSKKDFLMYSTSKGALKTMTQNMALELAPNINVLCICPAAVETPMLKAGLSEESYAKLKEYHPSQSIGDPNDLAKFLHYLAENNNFFTGANIEWDGGISKVLHDPE